jgi:hypothetical protein
MKSSVTFTADGLLSTKSERTNDIKKKLRSAPLTYRSNSTKEELCFEYVGTFLEQYKELYPKRQLPYMTAENEYGVKKFVCTTLRPTELPFQELYDLHECASFIAGYMIYEPLEPCDKPPTTLYSPTQTLNSYTGDSFDVATVLCSFLLGAGYDAYVVYGNAPRHIALKDQRVMQCPMISKLSGKKTPEPEVIDNSLSALEAKETPMESNSEAVPESKESEAKEGDAEAAETGEEGAPSEDPIGQEDMAMAAGGKGGEKQEGYKIPENKLKDSQFIARTEEEKKAMGKDNFVLWISNDVNDLNPEKDPKRVTRCHAWVLVRAGKREVEEDTFIEPATGRPYSTRNSPFTNIVSCWNHQNYFVNLQMRKKTSEMLFDLNDGKSWEYLFLLNDKEKSEGEDKDNEDEDGGMADLDAADEGESPEGFEVNRAFDCPPTWVDPLVMTRPKYLLRFPPTGKRIVQYHRAKAYFYASGVNKQCLSMKIIQYLDVECTMVCEINEWFENRSDKLYKRTRYLLDDCRTIDYYHPGSLGGVVQWTERPGKLIEIDFNVDSRLDRLKKRIEKVGENVVEHFDGRDDRLIMRSVDLTTDKEGAGARMFPINGGTLADEIYVLKMVQKYAPLPAPAAGDEDSKATSTALARDVAMRVFSIQEGKLATYYHFIGGKITGKVRTFFHTRGPSIPVPSEHALMQELGLEEDQDELNDAAALERECLATVKGSMQQLEKIVEYRREVEQNVKLERTVFDVALDEVHKITRGTTLVDEKATADDGDTGSLGEGSATISLVAADIDLTTADYLTPYLRNVKDINNITKEEALDVRQTCLDACKARLVERTNIIQARLNDENAKLSRKQEQFQRSQREGDLSTEDYEKYCTEAMFRISILEQRLVTHEEASTKKFLDLDVRLSNDPRLKVLKSAER